MQHGCDNPLVSVLRVSSSFLFASRRPFSRLTTVETHHLWINSDFAMHMEQKHWTNAGKGSLNSLMIFRWTKERHVQEY